MAWNDRLKEAAYNSPSGTRQRFDYEDVRRTVEKKTTAFDFPDANGTYVQDLGHTGRQYPLRVFFWGDDCDLEADAFEGLLLESGVGKLEHPLYGTVDVVPFGSITRRDDLKTAANQAIIEVTFWETIGIIYPTAQDDPGSAVLAAVASFNDTAAAQLDESLNITKAVERTGFKSTYQNLVDNAKAGLQVVADTQDNVRQTFDSIYTSINESIDTFIAAPLDLAFQTTLLVQAPARALTSVKARLSAYRSLASSIISGEGAVVEPGYDNRPSNAYHTQDLYASAYVTGSVLSVVNNQFETKTDALDAAAEVLNQFDQVAAWRDANYESLAEIDTGSAYQQLQEAVALTAGFLVFISFSLKQERRLVLDRSRTVIDLVAELYGTIDDQLDFFITSNSLSGSEILEIPAGREVVYYV